MTAWPPKEDVFGTPISLTTFDETMRLFEQRDPARAIVVNVCNVHSVMSARKDDALARAFARAEINTSDGVPLVWVLRSRGHRAQPRMYGPALAEHAFAYGLARGWRHYFYGATAETLQRLEQNLVQRFPGIQIAGMYAPPFRALDPQEHAAAIRAIKDSGAHIVWIGLGMPKQEKWMDEVRDQLPNTVLVGVGAAFDFLAGTKPQAPGWMQDAGLEWLFRLGTEPRRLWRRYLWNNPAFLALWLRELRRSRRG